MKILKFKCTLLTDVVLNAKSATEGSNRSIDFIPGGNFLGLAAKKLYINTNEETAKLFHSGNVRFGDAHPVSKGATIRSVHVPACMFIPKLSDIDGGVYVVHTIPNPQCEEILKLQLKQLRQGYYIFQGNKGMPIHIERSYALKSAYDPTKRRSEDGKMFGYESLHKGLELFFSVEVDEEELAEKVVNALVGRHGLGRSHSAQYGQVEIAQWTFDEIETQCKTGEVTVYADGRLIFLNNNGFPQLPKAEDLGLDGEIDWTKSQVRTFQYAPWNGKRKTYDNERIGIEKGSVLVVKRATTCPNSSGYVGYYKNEGFGRVIYNPSFIEADAEGKATVLLEKNQQKCEKPERKDVPGHTPLLSYVRRMKKGRDADSKVYKEVNDFVEKNAYLYKKAKFKSQWGSIRGIALSMKEVGSADLAKAVLDYIGHGVKADDWRGERTKVLQEFMNNNNDNLRASLVNLASAMCKALQKEDTQNRI